MGVEEKEEEEEARTRQRKRKITTKKMHLSVDICMSSYKRRHSADNTQQKHSADADKYSDPLKAERKQPLRNHKSGKTSRAAMHRDAQCTEDKKHNRNNQTNTFMHIYELYTARANKNMNEDTRARTYLHRHARQLSIATDSIHPRSQTRNSAAANSGVYSALSCKDPLPVTDPSSPRV